MQPRSMALADGVSTTNRRGGAHVCASTMPRSVAPHCSTIERRKLKIASPGILSVDTDNAGYQLTVYAASVTPGSGPTLSVDPFGGFNASVAAPGTYSFTYKAQNAQGTVSSAAATVTLTFPTGSGLKVQVVDGLDKTIAITDYRWIIEEDRTFYIDPNCTQNPPPAGCPQWTRSPR